MDQYHIYLESVRSREDLYPNDKSVSTVSGQSLQIQVCEHGIGPIPPIQVYEHGIGPMPTIQVCEHGNTPNASISIDASVIVTVIL